MGNGGITRRTKEWLRMLLRKTWDGEMIANLKEMIETQTHRLNLGDKDKANMAEEMAAAVIEVATEVTTEMEAEDPMAEMEEVTEAMAEVTEEMM
jgi:hypothetical protein